MNLIKTKLIPFLVLILCMGIFYSPVFASDGGEDVLNVKAAWTEGDMLKIDVINVDGQPSSIALKLSDYIKEGENSEYISVQAVDKSGNKSGVIQIKNPYYVPENKEATAPTTSEKPNAENVENPKEPSESSIKEDSKPFTPDGNGTVMDNVKDSDGKEFFTIDTESGNVFYLIVDRQKATDNVFFLNAVTEDDLIDLANKSDKTINSSKGNSAIPTTAPVQTETPTPSPTDKLEQETKPVSSDNNSTIIIILAVIIVGGIAYYVKIVRPKQNELGSEEGEYEDEFGYEDEQENEDEEVGDEE